VLLRDRTTATTVLVSVNRDGDRGGNGDSLPAGISADGRYALFESGATNLVAGDTNGLVDFFVRDLLEETTHLVTMAASGGSANRPSHGATMTPDGRYVAFVSNATNLVDDDTNGIPDVFLRDLQSGATRLVSAGAMSAGSGSFQNYSDLPQIAADGRYVTFYSTATNLVAGVIRSGGVYVRDLVAETTVLITSNSLSTVPGPVGLQWVAGNLRISDDGHFVAFLANTNASGANSATGMVLRFDMNTGLTDVIHTNAAAPFRWNDGIRMMDMTADGRYVTFVSMVETSGVTSSTVHLWDALGSTLPVTTASGTYGSLGISSNGQQIVFISNTPNLTTNALEGEFHIYVCDAATGQKTLLNAGADAIGFGVSSTTIPNMSADGVVIAFESGGRLTPDDGNRASDVFLYDALTKGLELISARHADLPALTANAGSGFASFSVSEDGRHVAFASDADDLVAGDTNNLRDVFVRDLDTGGMTLVSLGMGAGGSSLAAFSSEPAVSGDGRFVVFSSRPSSPGQLQQIYRRDLQDGVTFRVSVGMDGVSPGNGDSYAPTISMDGRWVLFRSRAGNLAAGSFGSWIENLFLRDMQAGTNYALSMASSGTGVLAADMTVDGRFVAFSGVIPGTPARLYLWDSQVGRRIYTNAVLAPSVVAVSPNGTRLGYNVVSGLGAIDRNSSTTVLLGPSSTARLQFSRDNRFLVYSTRSASVSADTNNREDVYLYDFANQARLLVSRSTNGVNSPNAISDWPTMSPDARLIAYRTRSSDSAPADFNAASDIFVFDRILGTTTLLSAERSENSTANFRSLQPIFSGNGRTIVFQSWASDMVERDFNQWADVFAFEVLALTLAVDGPSQAPVLRWPALPGHNYLAQYKDVLSDSIWKDVTDAVMIQGYRAYLTNSSPAASARFYRIISD
jgi:hypothetical protein